MGWIMDVRYRYLKEDLSRKELEGPLLLLAGVVHTAGQLPLQVHQGRLRAPKPIRWG